MTGQTRSFLIGVNLSQFMTVIHRFYLFLLAAILSSLMGGCISTQVTGSSATPPIRVEGTLFYPDESRRTYVVPAGAEIIGAGGSHCRYIVERGGRMTAHSGNNNVYKIEAGGAFKGFDHPAANCRVQYESGANVERVQGGQGVVFSQVN